MAETTLTYMFDEENNIYKIVGCPSISEDGIVVIPASHNGYSVASIETEAFQNNKELKEIFIPNTIKYIGISAFLECTNLTSVYINDLKSWCDIIFENTYSNPLSYANSLYVNNNLLIELSIPEDITTINNYAFYSCKTLTKVFIPKTIVSINN